MRIGVWIVDDAGDLYPWATQRSARLPQKFSAATTVMTCDPVAVGGGVVAHPATMATIVIADRIH